MRPIFIFHGTEGHPQENWLPWMKEKLEATGNYKVFVPQFPSPPGVPPKIEEWFEAFKEYEQHLNEDSIIIGHSLGGVFALRVLERRVQPIRAAVFVATFIHPIELYDFESTFGKFTFDWAKIKSSARGFIVYHSDTDPYVSLGNGKELAKNLGVKLSFIPNAGHFNKTAGYTEFQDLLDKVLAIK